MKCLTVYDCSQIGQNGITVIRNNKITTSMLLPKAEQQEELLIYTK